MFFDDYVFFIIKMLNCTQ